jgi:hypothetical protein
MKPESRASTISTPGATRVWAYSPALVKAGIEGRLPRGFGARRLMDLPIAWSNQWSAPELKAPAEA